MKKVLVIGGGAAGMMAAIHCAMEGAKVTLAEKNEKLGKKLFITGKGRCNVTNACAAAEFFENVVTNQKFLYSAVYSFTPEDVINFFESEGLKLKTERGQRVFPDSDKSSDVIRTLEKAIKKYGVSVRLNSEVKTICFKDGQFEKVIYRGGKEEAFDACIVATGGISYRSTGSTGDGYKFAEKAGHEIAKPLPSLVPLVVKENFVSRLEGLSLRNIEIQIDKFTAFGEMLFTSDGVSGPVILSASAKLCRKIAEACDGIKLYIDLKPALSEEQLDERILRDFSEEKNKAFKNSLAKLLPSKLIPVVVDLSGIEPDKKVNSITKQERKKLVDIIKKFGLTVTGTRDFNEAVITNGGIMVNGINPKTMESKLAKNLYFAGEVMDIDAYTGGFNLQLAWSTGALAGKSAAEGNEK